MSSCLLNLYLIPIHVHWYLDPNVGLVLILFLKVITTKQFTGAITNKTNQKAIKKK